MHTSFHQQRASIKALYSAHGTVQHQQGTIPSVELDVMLGGSSQLVDD